MDRSDRDSTVDPLDLDYDAFGQIKDDDDDDDERETQFTVEAILGHREVRDGKILYHIKWEGFDDESDQTWETEENFIGARPILDAYWKNPRVDTNKSSSNVQTPQPTPKSSNASSKKRSRQPSPNSLNPSSKKRSRQSSHNSSKPAPKKEDPPTITTSPEPGVKRRGRKTPLTIRTASNKRIRRRPGNWEGDPGANHTTPFTHLPVIDIPDDGAESSDAPPGTVSVGHDDWRPPSPVEGAWDQITKVEEIKHDEQTILWAFLRWRKKDKKGRFYRSAAKVDDCRRACPQRLLQYYHKFVGDSKPYSPSADES